ncbi:Arc family DNA-binding protein [Pectobacterium polaris]|uniref:Arc family DNA-binding protein n=1 Tax=Pectobacterium polaris TaxID=2042057 RepID=UPI001CF5A773|nr:Arc family DNA-binding protein [Pectobacterium polaris]MCA6941320.1 Arc family DNA-binding protein [Pectobacterium polaris]MCA6956374.1 Arc family DNA-binding protein [Pectobacterium polaris]
MARDEPKVNIRLPQEMKDKLHALAEKNKRSVNAEVVAAIELSLSVHNGGGDVVAEASKVTGGMGHSVKLMKPDAIENFINIVARSAAEAAVKALAKESTDK